MSTPPAATPEEQDEPYWHYCGNGADSATASYGCRGICIPGHDSCLAHLPDGDRRGYLGSLRPGSEVNHRGTPFDQRLLNSVLDALTDPETGRPALGAAFFEGATFEHRRPFEGVRFTGDVSFANARFTRYSEFGTGQRREPRESRKFEGTADFGGVTFMRGAGFAGATFVDGAGFGEATFGGDAWFKGVEFSSTASFGKAAFEGTAWFDERVKFSGAAWFGGAAFEGAVSFADAIFEREVSFEGAIFKNRVSFDRASFEREARFGSAIFSQDASFRDAHFKHGADFGEVKFTGDAAFSEAESDGDLGFRCAKFSTVSSFGPLRCKKTVDLSGAIFEAQVVVEVTASRLLCLGTRWESTATLRLSDAEVNLRDAHLSSPMAVTGRSPNSGVQVISVQGVDAAHLVLTNTDLTGCLFSGAFHLDRLRLEGLYTFDSTPAGIHRHKIWPYWWSRRHTLAEEHHWRWEVAKEAGEADPGWKRAEPRGADPSRQDSPRPPGPESLAATYRQLRKAFEDSKDEPGASDFYYGEMEMRRRSPKTPLGEFALLWMYWAVSGYGLRASRALLWLGLAMATTIMALMLWGLPTKAPLPKATGTITGSRITLSANSPELSITGDRLTVQRADAAARVAVNAVVFRTSGQNLTRSGTYIEMTSRIFEPVLLTLAVLAIRGRIKR